MRWIGGGSGPDGLATARSAACSTVLLGATESVEWVRTPPGDELCVSDCATGLATFFIEVAEGAPLTCVCPDEVWLNTRYNSYLVSGEVRPSHAPHGRFECPTWEDTKASSGPACVRPEDPLETRTLTFVAFLGAPVRNLPVVADDRGCPE